MEKPLKIYRASAGSGKTFTLAIEYIKLLILNPENYKHILAVTFTNKATAEMKERIVGKLEELSKGMPDADDYLYILKNSPLGKKYSEEEIRKRAGMALHNMIHDYDRFNIVTIDSFFQSIIRELARELNLTANLKVDLKSEEALKETVQSLIDELNKDSELYGTILNFVDEKISKGSNWNITKDIIDFGNNIFNENYLSLATEVRHNITDPKILREFKNVLLKKKDECAENIVAKAAAITDFCDANNLTMNMFAGKSNGLYASAEKLKDKANVKVFLDEYKDVYKSIITATYGSKKISKDSAVIAHEDELIKMAQDLLQSLTMGRKDYCTCISILSHLNHLMLINVINMRLRLMNEAANRFLLADSAHFLHELIDGSDIPFIYERTGNRFHHIMIDEFQDTSGLQWENFKPLLDNSLSAGNSCLIVGDVKQSIYRWRNSDWSILNNIETGDFASYIDSRSLETNYRSAENIIRFNNDFFESAGVYLNEEFERETGEHSHDLELAYSDRKDENGNILSRQVTQEINSKYEGLGYIRIDNNLDTDELEYETCQRIASFIHKMLKSGVRQSDIALLVRYKKHIAYICDYFMVYHPEIKLISNEAYQLGSSKALNLLMQVLRVVNTPDDRTLLSALAYTYSTEIPGADKDMDTVQLAYTAAQSPEVLLPAEFMEQIGSLAATPIYELCEKLYSLFGIGQIEDQDAYVFCFYDYLLDFTTRNLTGLASFIEYWDTDLNTTCIQSTNVDGVRVMTIHQSKGLEFHTVVVPFCNWNFNPKNTDLIWCNTDVEPFNTLDIVPVNTNKKTNFSHFHDAYVEEVLKNFVDNLNVMYVAFTRAKYNLFVIGDRTNKNKNKKNSSLNASSILEGCMLERFNPRDDADDFDDFDEEDTCVTDGDTDFVEEFDELNDNIDQEQHEEQEERTIDSFEYGTLVTIPGKDDAAIETIEVDFNYEEPNIEFRQSNASQQFITFEEEDMSSKSRFIDEGLIYHRILECMKTADSLDATIRKLDCEGLFGSSAQRDEIAETLRQAFTDPELKDWFDPRWKSLTEKPIIEMQNDGQVSTRRPDRVITDGKQTIVIDFKSGAERSGHKKQIKYYCDLLRRMGYPNVSGKVKYLKR